MKCAINTATHANRKRKDLLLKTFSLSHSDRISVSVKKNEVENVFQVAVVTSVLPIRVPISNVLVCKDIVIIIIATIIIVIMIIRVERWSHHFLFSSQLQ